MKLTLIFISFIFFMGTALAQTMEDDVEIRRLEQHWTKLLDQGDTTSLKRIWTNSYVVNNPNGKIVTPKDIIALMKEGHVFPKVERIIEAITFNDNIAVVMGKELQQPPSKTANKEDWIPRRFTNVWIKTKSHWQLASRQSSVICANN
jgi:ketosteroid isomerase-like protein